LFGRGGRQAGIDGQQTFRLPQRNRRKFVGGRKIIEGTKSKVFQE